MTDERDYADTSEEVIEDWDGFSSVQTDLDDESLHPATLVKLKKTMLKSKFTDAAGYDPATGTAPTIVWTFAITDADGYEIEGLTSESTGKKSKARPWIEALMGKSGAAEALQGVLSPDMLIGKPCIVFVTINNEGWPKVKQILPDTSQSVNAPQRAEEGAGVVQETAPPPTDDSLPF